MSLRISIIEKTINQKSLFNFKLEFEQNSHNKNRHTLRSLVKGFSIKNFLVINLKIKNKQYLLFILYKDNEKSFSRSEIEMANQILEVREDIENSIMKKRIVLLETLKSISGQIYRYDQEANQFFRLAAAKELTNSTDYSELLNEKLTAALKKIVKLKYSEIKNKSFIIKSDNIKIVLLLFDIENISGYDFYVLASRYENSKLDKSSELKNKFNLTNSEIRTIELLADGNNVNNIAEILNLRPSSIRQRLKQVYHKTSVNGQVELINLYNVL